MNSLKTLCVVTVLSAVGYGAYVTLTGRPMNEPPPEAEFFDPSAPQVQLPDLSGPAAPAATTPDATNTAATGPGAEPATTELSAAPSTTPVDAGPPASVVATAASESSLAATPAPLTPPTIAPPSSGGSSPPFMSPTVGPPTADPSIAPADSTSATTLGSTPPSDAGGPLASLTPAGIDATAVPQAADPHAEFVKTYAAVQAMLNQNRLADAHLELSQWYDNPQLAPAEQQQINDLLDQLAGTVVYSRLHLLEDMYLVQPGDTLERIAERYNVPWQLLAKINGIADPQYVRPGDQLKVVRGPFDAVVNLQKYELTLFLRGRYAGRFHIGIGQDQSTPEGEFSVKNKVANPTYYGPNQVIDANDPNNPLGERWIDLGNQIGIHGTNDPRSIGRAESRGCIRLSPADIEDVYDIVSIGSKVVIRR